MLDIKSQSQIADATADLMRAYALATATVAGRSMLKGMSLWTQMLRSSALAPNPAFAVACAVRSHPTWTVEEGTMAGPCEAQPGAEDFNQPAPDSAFSSYRSSGGHAVAQVIVPAET